MSKLGEQNHYKPAASQTVAYTAAAGTGTAVGAYTQVVRLVATTACFVRFGGTAVTTDLYLPANVPELFTINPSDTISAIRLSSDGNLHITEMTQ